MNPSIQLLDLEARVNAQRDLPLHAQVRGALRRVIDEHFEDGQKFWTENALTDHLGISQGTVRRALADLTREGVLQRRVAKGTFVCKRTPQAVKAVGVFVPDYNSELYTAMLDHISMACALDGNRLHVYHTHKGERIAEAIQQVNSDPADERFILLANPPRPTWELFESLDDRGYRTVNIGMPIKGYPGAYVGADDSIGVEIGVDYLTGLGHTQIVMLVNEPLQNPVITDRVRLFETAMKNRGLNPVVVNCGTQFWQSSYHAAYQSMDEVLALAPRPTAIFAASDQGAWAVLKRLAELGIKVPGEISVLGYDDVRPSEFMHPALTSIAQPMAKIAKLALELLHAEQPSKEKHTLAPVLTERESTGRAV